MAASSQPIVIAHHIMWTLYGWWLPNDLRGSTSRTIRNDLVAELGELHFGRKKVQPAGRDIRAFYSQAAAVLKYPLLSFAPKRIPSCVRRLGGCNRRVQVHL